jgi:hypothetical protein
MLVENMKLNDEDLEGLLFDLEQSKSFEGSLNLGGNNISDQVLQPVMIIDPFSYCKPSEA